MIALEEKILEDIKWRIDEISIIKIVVLRTTLSEQQKQILRRYTIPAFYSLWEGYVKDALRTYIEEINSLQLTTDQISSRILAHFVDTKYLKNLSTDFNKREPLISDLLQALKKPVMLPIELPTESNINLKVLNTILSRLNLQTLDNDRFKKRLDDFLNFRNRISHGDMKIPIDQTHIDKFSLLVIELMDEILLKISEGYKLKTYLSSNS
ncbi:hypothetical protein THII_2558 [Thioploca ingrica]|uniref:MAE-28990/MAE-18760-like HEPN domain-containing protein n=1 Tax=Thioploca ingrica TaxID=40754 RepID=A0A090AND4_9GAMM|nr:hypothetical protein THII_2558 [Thioploca ingrica]